MKKSSLRTCRFTLLELVLILICVSIGTFLLQAAFELKSPKGVQCTANLMAVGGARRGHGYQDAKPYTSAAIEEPEKLIVIADSADSDRKTGGAFLWPA